MSSFVLDKYALIASTRAPVERHYFLSFATPDRALRHVAKPHDPGHAMSRRLMAVSATSEMDKNELFRGVCQDAGRCADVGAHMEIVL